MYVIKESYNTFTTVPIETSADILSVMMNTAPPMNRQGDVGFDCREEAARFTRGV